MCFYFSPVGIFGGIMVVALLGVAYCGISLVIDWFRRKG